MLRILLLFASLVLLVGCKTYTVDELPSNRLYFGSGGGFAGAFTEYLLLENGQLFKRESQQAEFVALPKVRPKQAQLLFSNWTEQKMDGQDFQHPGNLYYFLKMEKEGQTHRLSWGSSKYPTPEAIKQFYSSCSALIPKLETSKK